MTLKRYLLILFSIFFLVIIGDPLHASNAMAAQGEETDTESASNYSIGETALFSDRFIFISRDVDELLVLVFVFERGKLENKKYYAQFLGGIFERNHWSFLQGNGKYILSSTDIEAIHPSYYAKAEGSDLSGFVVEYDAGDYTLKLSGSALQTLYEPDQSETLKKRTGIAEALVTVKGKERWGDLIHESFFWNGFDGLQQYEGLYKDYQSFYLKTETGKTIYFHKNEVDKATVMAEYGFSEIPESEGGVIFEKGKALQHLKTPIRLTQKGLASPPFAMYKIPERWELDMGEDTGELFLWIRDKKAINWFTGAYTLMAIEGVIKLNGKEERVWGFGEFLP